MIRRLAVLLSLALAFAACGIPTDSGPRQIAERRVPLDLVERATATSTSQPQVETVGVVVYLVAGERLVATHREVLAPSVLPRVIAALLNGPTSEESARGVRTALPNDASLLSARVESGTATVNLSNALTAVSGQEQILALGQMVFTATDIPGVERVLFALDGRPIEVPRADGTLTTEPLNRSDYSSLQAPTA